MFVVLNVKLKLKIIVKFEKSAKISKIAVYFFLVSFFSGSESLFSGLKNSDITAKSGKETGSKSTTIGMS